MALAATDALQGATVAQVTPQQIAITQRSTELISNVMLQIVGGRNNPDKGLPSVRNISGIGTKIDYHA